MERYECDKCGVCCKGHLLVEADELDVLREPRLIDGDPHYAGKSVDQIVELFTADVGRCIMLAGGRACTFLGEDKHCGIYPTRPNACVGMQAGDEQCQAARAAAGLPPLEPQQRDQA